MSRQIAQLHSFIATFAKAVDPANRNRQSHVRGTGRPRWSIASLTLALFLLCGVCAVAEAFEPIHATVTEVDQFGDIAFDKGQGDLDRIGLEYGDSVDLRFSGGQELKGVPYYSDFFGRMGDPSLVVYFGTVKVGGFDCNLNEAVGVEPGETVTITLDQKGRYKAEYEAYNINNAAYRMEGQTDEAFLNAREVTAGNIRPGRLYRSASPFDPDFGRVELMASYLVEHNIGGILNLSNNQEKLESFEGLPDHTAAMIDQGLVIACRLGVDYLDPDAMRNIGEGLVRLMALERPWLIHCNLGKDRTGVICAVLEALCGASYDEIEQDYMFSYDQLHNIDMNPESLQYRLYKTRIDDQLVTMFSIRSEALPTADLRAAATDYLARCGMTQNQIDRLVDLLNGE